MKKTFLFILLATWFAQLQSQILHPVAAVDQLGYGKKGVNLNFSEPK